MSRKSVNAADLGRYEEFKSKFDPQFMKEKLKDNKIRIDWGNGGSGNVERKKKNDDMDDLYSG